MGYYGRQDKKVEKFRDKISSTGFKWSSLNVAWSETPVSHSLLGDSLFPFSVPAPSFLPLSGVIRNGLLWEAGQKGGNLLGQNQLNILQMVQFEFPKVLLILVSSTYESNCRRSLSFVSERRLAPRCTAMPSVESNAVCRRRKQARFFWCECALVTWWS